MIGKRKNEVVDFTILEKLKKKRNAENTQQQTPSQSDANGGFLDFTSPAPQSSNTATDTGNTQTQTFGFLSDFAASSTQTQSFESTNSHGNNDEFSALKIKVDDIEYKLDRLLERLSEIETKFSRA